MKKLYYITRTFVKPEQGKSCVLIRNAYVDLLKKFYQVIVVTPSYNRGDEIDEDLIKLHYKSKFLYPYMERMGFMEDYLDPWVETTVNFLMKSIKNDDIVFATSGGELACIKIASLLKQEKKCKFVINFRDPIDYSYIDGKKTCGYFHVSREKAILKYLSNVDLVITSSDKFREILQDKYKFIKNRIINSYTGYIEEYHTNVNHPQMLIERRRKDEKTRLVFGGSMNKPQGAEIFTRLLKKRDDIEVVYIGEPNKKILNAVKEKKASLLKSMSHDAYLQYVTENADIGLVSLAKEPFKACFPSKICEYINLEIPILAALPDGDARKMINEKGYGRAVAYGNIEELNNALEYILENYESVVHNIQRDKAEWAMQRRISELMNCLQGL